MKMKNFQFSKYCTPAQLYLIIGVICIISAFFKNYSIETLLAKALFLVVWAWVLNWLCSKGFKAISWIFVLLPFIFFLFTYFLVKDVAVKEGYCTMDPTNISAFLKCVNDEKAAQAAAVAAAQKAAQAAMEDAKRRQAEAQAKAEQMRKDNDAKIAKAAADAAAKLCGSCPYKVHTKCIPKYCKA